MNAVRAQLEPAYLLSQRPYRETSALLEIFSAAHGRVGLVARGVRGPKSRQRGALQLFQRLLLSWTERGELGTLTGAEAGGPAAVLAGEAIFSGWYLNELLLRLLQRHDPHPLLFAIYEATLQQLAASPDLGVPSPPAGEGGPKGRERGRGTTAESALRLFELHLLAELGYGLQLPNTLDPSRTYRYDFERGPVPQEFATSETYPGASLLALAKGKLDSPESLRDAKRLLRAALALHLGGRPLETPRLLRKLRRRRPGQDA
ncbi:MAG: DNA repair protein RecO [Gammaproteobacteria bacterium]|nr:DNA repair protein RecO [Gammaproteobacteria bacterium]